MALPEDSLSIVEQWKKKSIEMSLESNDYVVSLLTKSIDTIAVVLNKKSDFDNVRRALISLESERALSFQLDKNKNDEVRSLVYGQIECLHFALSELTNNINQIKEYGEMFTQTEIIPNLLEYPKEEPFDEISIKIEELWGDDMEIKNEEIFDDDVDTPNADGDIACDREDISSIVDNDDMTQSEMPVLDYMGDQFDFENEDVKETMNNSKGNETIEEDNAKVSSETEQQRKSSRKVSRPTKFTDCESSDNSDEDFEPTKKKLKAGSSKNVSGAIDKKGGLASLKGIPRQMKCPECEYQTPAASTFTHHLRYVHFTTLGLAGLALRCDCGVEVRSEKHGDKCDIANFTLVRKREGPINRIKEETTTPQCVLCDMYPKTASGYMAHLRTHHKSTLVANGIWLLCECGAKYRHLKPDYNHTEECTRREYTLHKVADK